MGVSSAEYTLEKTMTLGDFFAFIVPKIGCFSTNSFFVCDTCDSKKTKSLLEGARIYAQGLEVDKQSEYVRRLRYAKAVRRENRDLIRQRNEKARGARGKSVVMRGYCYVERAKYMVCKIKMLLFRDFFTLWGFFNPDTYRRSV